MDVKSVDVRSEKFKSVNVKSMNAVSMNFGSINVPFELIRLFVLLIPIFETPYLRYNYHRYWALMLYAVFIWEILTFLYKKRLPSVLTVLFGLLELYLVAVTAARGGDTRTAIAAAVRVTTLILIFQNEYESFGNLLSALNLHVELYTFVNLILIIIYPNGIYNYDNTVYGSTDIWYLGNTNAFIMWLLPALVVSWMHAKQSGELYRALIVSMVAVFTELYRGSATGLVGLAMFLALVGWPYIKQYLTPVRCIVGAVSGFVLIVLCRVTEFLRPIIVDVLGKDMTFNNRMFIWDNAIEVIRQNPIFGYGYMDNQKAITYLGRAKGSLWGGATHCHCNYLQIMFQGGLIAAALLFLIYFFTVRANTMFWKSAMVQVALFGLTAYSIMGITENLDTIAMYLIFTLAYYVGETRALFWRTYVPHPRGFGDVKFM